MIKDVRSEFITLNHPTWSRLQPEITMKLNPIATILKLAAAGLLFGALWRHQHDYYTLMRWVVCGVSAFGAFQAVTSGKSGWVWALAVVALVFNPIVPIHLKRETWAFIDSAVAVFLLISIAFIDRRTSPP